MKISELPQEIKKLALLRQQECLSSAHDKGTDNLCLAFDWGKTQENHEYWEEYYWAEYEITEEIIAPKNYDDVIAIIETKIATMSSRGFESYYLPIGILKDLIREIKDIK